MHAGRINSILKYSYKYFSKTNNFFFQGGFPSEFDFEDYRNGFYDFNDAVTESDVKWAIENQGIILGDQPGKTPECRKKALLFLLQSISRMDYHSFNRPVCWEDKEGNKHIGVYHPMDLLHQVVDKLNISSRCKFFQKLSLCKLAVPVLLKNDNLIYMQKSLHHVKCRGILVIREKRAALQLQQYLLFR